MTTLEKIISKCKAAGACEGEFKKLIACPNLKEAWLVLVDNMWWVFEENILDIEDWKELLESGVDCTKRNNHAICWASRYGHLKVVKLLLKHGADCTANDNYAIFWASRNGHLEVVELLKQHVAQL